MTIVHEDQRMGSFRTPNIEGTLVLPLQTKKIPIREINMVNPLEKEAYGIQEGFMRNLVLTSDEFIVEITPKEIKYFTTFNGYKSKKRVEIENHEDVYFNHVLGALEGLIHHALDKSRTVIIEKNVQSPFIDNANDSCSNE